MKGNIFTSKQEIADVTKACEISKTILDQLVLNVVEGSTSIEINSLAESLCEQYDVKPSFRGVPGPISDFPGNLCVSVNDETLHTIPNSERRFTNGDLVKIDFGIIYKGIFTDHCVTKSIGKISKEEKRLIETTKLAVDMAIKQAKTGNRVGDVSFALEQVTNLSGFTSIRGFAGHGIGYSIHEDPNIPYIGEKGKGEILKKGMLICVEIQLSLGSGRLKLDKDGWTLRTEDGSKTAMFEHMVLVDDIPKVLTR